MSAENLKIVQRVYDVWQQGDFKDRDQLFDPKVEFTVDVGIDVFTVHGAKQMTERWLQQLAAWEHWHSGPIEEMREHEDAVAVFSRVVGTGRRSGIGLAMDACAVFEFEAGKIVRLMLFDDRAKGLEAAGLPQQP